LATALLAIAYAALMLVVGQFFVEYRINKNPSFVTVRTAPLTALKRWHITRAVDG
jgi:hypothetical protein